MAVEVGAGDVAEAATVCGASEAAESLDCAVSSLRGKGHQREAPSSAIAQEQSHRNSMTRTSRATERIAAAPPRREMESGYAPLRFLTFR